MYLLYEEDGQFKSGTIVADNDSSLQIDSQFGKRIKLRAAQVMLRYSSPMPAEFMQCMAVVCADLDVEFLWEVAGTEEFDYTALATEYFGRPAQPVELAGVLQSLHESPMHFYKKGRGHYRPAPADALGAAKASVVRKQREAELMATYVSALTAFQLPEALRNEVDTLLFAPDKQQLSWRAVDAACKQTGLSPVRLLDRCGAIPSSHDYHFNKFVQEYFPRGIGFVAHDALTVWADLPLAHVQAFSIDDASTTEIDDAFSVQRQTDGSWLVGIHIAVPALGILPDSVLDQVAARRLSTVYYPGGKITMLPDDVVSVYSLKQGETCPAMSMYLQVADESWEVLTHRTCIERVPVVANLRHETLQSQFNVDSLTGGHGAAYPWQTELTALWHLSGALEAKRGKTPDTNQPQKADYQFKVDNDWVAITDRQRGNPVDRVVSELMILVNAEWGKWLADSEVIALYRTQQNGKVKMSTRPAPHVGLGVAQYTWASSPLRRYVDLVNQRQLLALVQGLPPTYPAKSDVVYTVLRDFELAYDAYSEFQRKMERYWCLRWLQQEQLTMTHGAVIKENLVRLHGLPMVVRVPSLPELAVGSCVELIIDSIDLLDVELHCTWQRQANVVQAESVPPESASAELLGVCANG